MRSSRFLALCLVLTAAGCARDERRPAPVPPQRPAYPAPTSPSVDISAAAYVANAAAIDLYEIRSAELALQRSSNRAIQEFASMMIAAHRGTSAQLSFAGRRLNLLPSATLDAKRQAMLDQLQSSADFDRLYRDQQRTVHAEALALHRSYAARGTSPTLRPVASAMVPIVERHMRLLRYL